ncbi:MAG: hypothetical protein KDJ74_09735 [Notoacmeibacter sp.]|nr:hypothetical protein [Notoacmeibacter sp.]
MNRILIASALILGATGFAAAENPTLYSGNYSASVLNQYGAPGVAPVASPVDTMNTASVAAPLSFDNDGAVGTITKFDIHSGR